MQELDNGRALLRPMSAAFLIAAGNNLVKITGIAPPLRLRSSSALQFQLRLADQFGKSKQLIHVELKAEV